MLQGVAAAEPSGKAFLTFEEVCAELQAKKVTSEQLNAMLANAKMAQKYKTASDLQVACLTMAPHLQRFVDMLEAAGNVKEHYSTALNFPNDFAPGAEDIRMVTWDDELDAPEWLTLKVWLSTTLCMRKALVMVGAAGDGKTSLLKALCRLFCRRKGLDFYGCAKALDPLGLVTRAGDTGKLAAFLFHDLDLKANRGQWLSEEHMKGLLDTNESGAFDCRYAEAILPAHHPRMFAVNSQSGPDGWFRRQGLDVLAEMTLGNWEEVKKSSEHAKAIARRCCIAIVSREQIGLNKQVVGTRLEAMLAEELARAG